MPRTIIPVPVTVHQFITLEAAALTVVYGLVDGERAVRVDFNAVPLRYRRKLPRLIEQLMPRIKHRAVRSVRFAKAYPNTARIAVLVETE